MSERHTNSVSLRRFASSGGLQGQDVGGREALEEQGVGGRELPAAQPRMRGQETVEWITRPTQLTRAAEPLPGWRFVKPPALIVHQRDQGLSLAQPQTAGFNQKLNLEYAGGGQVDSRKSIEKPDATVPLRHPDDRVRVEQNHRRFRRGANVTPVAPAFHDHCPVTTAGST